jgi:hypothetical protein
MPAEAAHAHSHDYVSAYAPPSASQDSLPSASDPRPAPGAEHKADDDASDFGSRIRGIASRVGPPLASAGRGAKGALGALMRTIREKRASYGAKGHERAKAKAPKRTTAPPPSGALRSDGRRLFREQLEDGHRNQRTIDDAKPDRKRTVFAAVLGVLSVIAIYAVADRLSGQDPEGATAVAAADGAHDAKQNTTDAAATSPVGHAAGPGAGSGEGAAAPPAAGSPIATANVPLFGATPLSTTEPVPPAPGEAALPKPAQARVDAKAKPAIQLDREWGVGAVEDPTVIRLRMDGKIAGIAGAEGATGFTVVVSGRQAISSAAGLARKDRRIDSVNIVNYPDRAEITFHFKGDIPPFLVKARGKRLIIELGHAKKKTKKAKKKKKKKAKKAKKKKRKKKSKRRAKKRNKKKKKRRRKKDS